MKRIFSNKVIVAGDAILGKKYKSVETGKVFICKRIQGKWNDEVFESQDDGQLISLKK